MSRALLLKRNFKYEHFPVVFMKSVIWPYIFWKRVQQKSYECFLKGIMIVCFFMVHLPHPYIGMNSCYKEIFQGIISTFTSFFWKANLNLKVWWRRTDRINALCTWNINMNFYKAKFFYIITSLQNLKKKKKVFFDVKKKMSKSKNIFKKKNIKRMTSHRLGENISKIFIRHIW